MKRNPSRINSTTVLMNDGAATRTGEDFYAGVPVLGLKENALKIQAATAAPNHYATTQNRSVLVPAVPEAFAYDADGNLLKDGLWTYEWDAENRLVAQELRSDVSTTTWKRLEYSYDKESRRVRKLVKTKTSPAGSWTTASDTRFLYDGWNLLAEYSYVSSTFTLLRSHAWGLDLSGSQQGAGGVGGLLWTTVAATAKTYAATADANGNIIAYVDCSDGSIAGKRDYGAFGDAVLTTGVAGSLPFGFSTKYEEKESGLYYYGFRYYNPSTGRWPNRDPIGERGGANPYGMIKNNPISLLDFLGLSTIWLNFGFDSSASANRSTIDFINRQKNFLQDKINECCAKYNKACGVTVKSKLDYNSKNKPAPNDGVYDKTEEDLLLQHSNASSISGHPDGLNIIITGSTVDDAWARTAYLDGDKNNPGVVIQDNAPRKSTAHEAGHVTGCETCKDYPADGHPQNDTINSTSMGGKIDECWCNNITKLAK